MSDTYLVTGMTCEGCVRAVTNAIQRAVPGAAVEVELETGRVTVDGADGGSSSPREGCGGGGGGGIVHMLAPIITNNGTVSVRGGRGGQPDGVLDADIRAGGGGGGASGGDGGSGRTAPANNNPAPANDGQDGYAFETLTDPTALF